MESVSTKSLWGLISGGGIQTEKGIIETELLAQEDILTHGLLHYKPPNKDTRIKFDENKSIGDSWRDFIIKLSPILGVEENRCWEILCSYLAAEFRGTSESLALLLKNDIQSKPLLLDIWQFYRAERLYLLQILKEILISHSNEQNIHQFVFVKVLDKIDENSQLKQNLIDQFESVIQEVTPKTESILGSSLTQSYRRSWTHFHLREQSELLQLLLIYIHQTEKSEQDFLTLSDLFSRHEFGSKLQTIEEEVSSHELVATISQLEAATLVLLLDLPTIQSSTSHHVFKESGPAVAVEKFISGLGNLSAHGSPMLAFTLGCYLSKGQEGLAGSARFGEVAIGGNVLQTLLSTLKGDHCASGLVSDILNSLVYSTLSALVSAFDPSNLGLTLDTHNLVVQLLGHRLIAHHFWKSPSGLALYFTELKKNFPLEHSPLLDVCTSLATASSSSCSQMISALASLPCFTDSLELLPVSACHLSEGKVQLTSPLYPYPGTESVILPAGTQGVISQGGTSVCWSPPSPQNGWQMILADIGHLVSQAKAGAGSVLPACLKRVISAAKLVAAILSSDPSLSPQLSQISHSLLSVMAIFGQLPSPPLGLMSSITEIFASLAGEDPSSVLNKLSVTALLPRVIGNQLQPGVVGHLLATQETVAGEYPSLIAFLKLTVATARETSSSSCISFILSEVLPQFSRWRYEVAGDREKVAMLSLTAVLRHGEEPEGLQLMSGDTALASCLLSLSSTGDRAVQTLLEAQTNWETGRGADLASVVHLCLTILHKLITSEEAGPAVMSGPVGMAIRAPPQGSAPHYLLTLAHYTYFFHRPELAISAVQLLTAISSDISVQGSPVSVLACLSGAATAVKDMLLSRLESNTEDIRLKIAIVDLLTACVDQQPGMVQLLMDINTDIRVVGSDAKGTSDKKPGSSSPELVGEGCLAPVLKLLGLCNGEVVEGNPGPWLELHLSIVKLVDCLWSRGRILAAQHLKEQTGFWSSLCHPLISTNSNNGLADEDEVKAMKIKAFVLRVVSHEIYTWTGKISDGLGSVIEKICDEKSPALINWCDVEDNDCSDNTTIIDSDPDENIPLFLLAAWRAFFLVLSKDSPSSLTPAACRAVFLSTTTKLSSCLGMSPPPPRLTVILSETSVILARRWQTKTTDCMDSWCSTMSSLLDLLVAGWISLHPRARLAILALSLSTLKVSQFKLEPRDEETVLKAWLDPVLSLLSSNFRELEAKLQSGHEPGPALHGPELCLSILHGLLNRLPAPVTLSALHREASIPLLLSAVGACCRAQTASSLVLSILPLLLEVGSSASGATCLLLQDLARDLWLPLSDLPSPHPDWLPVRQAGLELAGTLVRVAKRSALDTAVTVAALMTEKIAGDLMSPRQDLSNLSRAATSIRFVASLSSYSASWQADHPVSIQVIYRASCRLLHTATALLMRPSFLSVLVNKGEGGTTSQEEVRRVRRMSSTSCAELEMDSVVPEAAPAHSLLLEICLGCVTFLSSLSPPLPALLSGSALQDPDRWEPLLGTTFSGPTLEQDGDIPSYGTLIALANVCVRSVARDSARSPSPARSAASPVRGRPSSAPPPDTPERRKLSLLLERCLILLLQQSLLSLALSQSNTRETQLLRRELGAELGSITDTWRRYLHRSGGRSPGPVRGAKSPGPAKSPAPLTSTPSRRAKSPQPPPSPQPQGRTSRADTDNFMKFISSLVHNMFK